MSNPRNHGVIIGRLANDPVVFTNSDDSKNVKFTVFADRNFTNKDGERDADALPVEAFVRSSTNGTGPFANIHKGDLVAVQHTLRMDRYTRKTGEVVYELKAQVEDITFLEPRSVTQARLAERVQSAERANTAAKAAVPAAVAAAPMASAVAAPSDEQLPFA
jgi:single-strand DNA-binding protein